MSDTRPLPAAPSGYRAGRRRRRAAWPGLVARDFMIIITTWAVTAYPILWVTIRVIAPAILGGSP